LGALNGAHWGSPAPATLGAPTLVATIGGSAAAHPLPFGPGRFPSPASLPEACLQLLAMKVMKNVEAEFLNNSGIQILLSVRRKWV